MKRRFRLTKSTDIKRVWRFGKSYVHPFIVLMTHPNQLETSRFTVTAGRSVGKAVQRNRAKRWLREALRPNIPRIVPGWDVLIVARQHIANASFQNCQNAMQTLLNRAHLLKDPHDD